MTAFGTAAEIGAAIDAARRDASGIDFIRQIQCWRLEPSWQYPEDPRSEAYHEAVLRHYEEVAGRPYASPAANEAFPAPKELHLPAPFPHCSADPGEVSLYMLGVAHIIGLIARRPPARIAEFGSGWGHVAFNLSQMGFEVTAFDINRDSVELLRERARRNEVRLDVRECSFLEAELGPGAMDVGIFFESFHHCHRPFDLLAHLERWIAPGGQVIFAAEPFYRGFHAPWDVRLDGQSVWAARANGWLELGFEESFFVRTLMRRGWAVRKRMLPAAGAYGVVYVATRHGGAFIAGECFLPPEDAERWAPHDDEHPYPHRWTCGASPLTLDADPRWRRVSVNLSNFHPRTSLTANLTCGPCHATRKLAPGESADVDLLLPEDEDRELRIESPTWVPRDEGVNQDARTIGVAVGRILYHDH